MAVMTNIRRATAADAPVIAALKTLCWPAEPADAAHMAEILTQPDHITTVVVQDGVLVGFVDGFLTLSPQGARRWEVDLLGVHPDHRRQGLARILISANFGAARRFGPAHARALIRTDNLASQRAFAQAGFTAASELNHLMVTTNGSPAGTPAPPDSHLIPVQTLGYQGVWVEGVISREALAAAQHVCARFGWDVAGCVIPQDNPTALATALALGYDLAGEYAWWTRTYP